MKTLLHVGILALCVGAAACNMQQAPAEAALKAAQDAFNGMSAEAQKYVPDQAKAIQSSLAAMQDAIAKSDFSSVIAQAPAITTKLSSLGAAIAAKKTELTTAWTSMTSSMPAMVTSLSGEVDKMMASRRLPAGVTKEAVAAAKTGMGTVNEMWTKAMAAAATGDALTATQLGAQVQSKVNEIMASLKLQR